MIGRQIGNYRVLRQIGEGGMGEVYLAEHPRVGRQVAIKVLPAGETRHPNAVVRFEAEARALSLIQHPNVIDLYDFGELGDGGYYIVMELLRGRDLARILADGGAIGTGALRPYLTQICSALDAAHRRGVVHRDLKPENIFVLDPGDPIRLKVLDFGLAKLLPAQHGPRLTRSGIMVGTPLFLAPEQAAGNSANVTPQADIYSLGVVLYNMVAGRPPFVGDEPAALVAMHLYDPPPPLEERAPDLAPGVADLIHLCLEKRPDDRPPSVAQLVQMYEAAATDPGQRYPRKSTRTTLPGKRQALPGKRQALPKPAPEAAPTPEVSTLKQWPKNPSHKAPEEVRHDPAMAAAPTSPLLPPARQQDLVVDPPISLTAATEHDLQGDLAPAGTHGSATCLLPKTINAPNRRPTFVEPQKPARPNVRLAHDQLPAVGHGPLQEINGRPTNDDALAKQRAPGRLVLIALALLVLLGSVLYLLLR
jgi:serine/threonine-protein kinase